MGTNYYIHKKDRLPREDLIHIGKSVYKKPKGEFLWAIDPHYFKEECVKADVIVVDESRKRCSSLYFMDMIKDRNWNCEHVGTSFS